MDAGKTSREELAGLITLKLLMAKPENPLAHLQSVLADMNKRKRDMDFTDCVTSELERLYLTPTEGAQAYADKMSLEKFAELIKLKLVIAKPEDPILHVKHELEDMNERKRDMNAVDFVTSELQRLSVLPCDWMEEKEGKAIVRYLADAVGKGIPAEDPSSLEEHFNELRKT